MPTYDYQCVDCGYEFEYFQGMSDEPLRICPKCNGNVRRKISGGAGLIFKGSGYYITDYKNKSATADTKKTKKIEKQKITKKKEIKNDKL